VSKATALNVTNYIRNQQAHHQTQTFQEEYLEFLQKAGVEL
jgi:hypothetical protein